MTIPARVRLIDVAPRDGLQNEKRPVPTATKLMLIRRLVAAGIQHIEATSFVSPKWVPQMADATDVMAALDRTAGITYSVLVPNLTGAERALAAGATELGVFAAATESFSRRNTNCSIAESLDRFGPVMAAARAAGARVRGYVSCVLGCPYEGEVSPQQVAEVAWALYDLGCQEIGLGDTLGTGTPAKTQAMIEAVARRVPIKRLIGHFHDTWGMAIANIHASLQLGVASFDAATGGLGGCPFAAGATGNVAMEDVVYLLDGLGIDTGIDLRALSEAGAWINGELGLEYRVRAGRACLSRHAASAVSTGG